MSAKFYLSKLNNLRFAIRKTEEQIEELRAAMESVGAIRYDKLNVQSTPENPIETNISSLIELEERAVRIRQQFMSEFLIIQNQIMGLEKPLHQSVLYYRYVSGYRLDEVAETLGYSLDYVYTIHGEALRAFATKYHL